MSEISAPERRLERYPEAVQMLERGEANDRLETALAMIAGGVRGVDIGEELGIARTTIFGLLKDPSGTAARDRKMRGVCEDCGTAIFSDNPSRGPQRRCSPCQHAHKKANAKWTRETIIEALQRWNALYGSPPSSAALCGQGRAEDVERYHNGDFPPLSQIVRQYFPRYGDALRAAGFEPRHPGAGKPRPIVSEETYRAMQQMRDTGATYPEIAAHFGIKTPAAQMRLKRWKHLQSGGRPMPASLKAETVIEREIARFQARKETAEAEAADAAEQVERLNLALTALTNGKPKD